MDADAPGRVAPRVTLLRLVADPRSRAEIVVVARRYRNVDRIGDRTVAVGPERSTVERLAGLPGQASFVVRRTHELVDLDDDVVARTKAGAMNGDGNHVTRLRRKRDARLSPVAPRLDARVDAEQQARNHQAEARIDRDLFLGRAFAEGEGGDRAREDRDHGEPEGAVAGEWVVARHVTDQASGNGEPGQDSTERRYCRKQEACCSLHTLPYRQEPRHDGAPPSFPTAFAAETTLQLSTSG